MFRIEDGKGFHITFENGYTVSVQFGPGNYCDHRNKDFDKSAECGKAGSRTAECAVWHGKGPLLQLDWWDGTVKGWMRPAEVLALLVWAAAQEVPK
jgi:hypothetical protein